MKRIAALALLLLCAGSAMAQECASSTGNNAVVIFPEDVLTNLQDGDIITAHFDALCVGRASYQTGESLALTVWGDDSMTPEVDGILAGEIIDYSVTRPSTNSTQDDISVDYEDGADGVYQQDAILQALTLLINGPLPVELTAFEAMADGHDVRLTWTTASETNNAGFEIQHQAPQAETAPGDHGSWQAVSFVEGAGTTLEAQHYAYRIPHLAPGRHVLRLKQIDFDGTFAYSPEVEVTVQVPEHFFISEAYPNPFNPQTTLTLTLQRAEDVTIRVYDIQGRLIKMLYQGLVEANTPMQVQMEGSTLASGTYFIRFQGRSFSTTRQAILLK